MEKFILDLLFGSKEKKKDEHEDEHKDVKQQQKEDGDEEVGSEASEIELDFAARKAARAAVREAVMKEALADDDVETTADAAAKRIATEVVKESLRTAMSEAISTGDEIRRKIKLRDRAEKKAAIISMLKAKKEAKGIVGDLIAEVMTVAEDKREFLEKQEEQFTRDREAVEKAKMREFGRLLDEEGGGDQICGMMSPEQVEVSLPTESFDTALLECGMPVEMSGDMLLRICDLQHLPPIRSDEVLLPRRKEMWPMDEVRRHWLLKNHCEWLLIPAKYPTLRLISGFGNYLWRQHTSEARPNQEFLNQERRSVSAALRDIAMNAPQPEQILLCDQLFHPTRHDIIGRNDAIRRLCRFFLEQRVLLMVSLERARLQQREVTALLRDLGAAAGDRLQRLYLWHCFDRQLPTPPKKEAPCGYDKGRHRPSPLALTNALPMFSALTVLASNYCYLADDQGEALLTLTSLRTGTLRTLELLLVEEETPGPTRPGVRSGPCACRCCVRHPSACCARACSGHRLPTIPDWAWRRACVLCPALRVHLVVCSIPNYDAIACVLSRSLPLAELHWSTGMDLRFRQPWLIDCVFRDLRAWYTSTLQYLSLHLWRNRDKLDSDLLKSINDFPLIALEFIGYFHNLATMRQLCERALIERPPQCGSTRLARLWLRPQVGTLRCGDDELRSYTDALVKEFRPKLALRGIHFHCSPYHV